jgi:two-component system nitrogen regulation sensor histidine kinase NtrY
MTPNSQSTKNNLSIEEQRRRRRERILIVILIAVVSVLAVFLNRSIYLDSGFPLSNQVLMFILLDVNLLLLLLLIFLVVRNVVKLLYDRKRKVMGAKLRMRLVIAFVSLTLLPTTVLFVFSINFITSSINFWFNVPIEQALENSMEVARTIYQQIEKDNRFLIERVAGQIRRKALLDHDKTKTLSQYIAAVQREFNAYAIEIYGVDTHRMTYALTQALEEKPFERIAAENFTKDRAPDGVYSLTVTREGGDMLRTIGTVPFNAPPGLAQGYVVVSANLTGGLSDKISSITRGFEEYQQIKLLKRPIQASYFITLSVVASLVVFCAVWFGFYLAKTITIPIMQLAQGTRRVAEGDLSFSLDIQADDEIGSLVSAFNKMTKDLRVGREQLELSAQMLRQQNVEIEERRRYMEIVLKNVSAGVITMDAQGVVTTLNTAAGNMLSLQAEKILNRNYSELLSGPHLKLAGEIVANLIESRDESAVIPLRLTINGRPRSFLAYINALKDEAGRNIGMVMVIDDLTELEKAQRMAAWREVARRIAHEVKNPLTPISLSAQRLRRKYSHIINEPVFDECTNMIINHVELIRNLVNEFSAFARFPAADPKPFALPPIIEETVALYREGHPNIEFVVDLHDEIPVMNLDRQQIKQAMINLVDNAVSAIRAKGEIRIGAIHDPILKLVRIEVADNGIGVSSEDKIRLFEPNFSTKKSGMGLGLTIVNSIITDHRGVIRVQDNYPRGAKFIIELPI